MKRILLIQSSIFDDKSASARVADALVKGLLDNHPGSSVTRLDLARENLEHLQADEFKSWSVPADQRNEEQASLARLSDELIGQLLAHDTLVLAVPMYNLGIPSTLKTWIDRVTRAGMTFRYTEDGPQGLVEGMRAYLVFARGGVYRGTERDTQTGYLKSLLGLIGITEVETVFAEGLNMGEAARQESLDGALSKVEELVAEDVQEMRYEAA